MQFMGVIFTIILSIPAVMCWKKWKLQGERIDVHLRAIRHYEQLKTEKELEGQQEITVGNYILCPHCEKVFEFVKSENWPEGLKHCLGCGKQFYTSQGRSYPATFK